MNLDALKAGSLSVTLTPLIGKSGKPEAYALRMQSGNFVVLNWQGSNLAGALQALAMECHGMAFQLMAEEPQTRAKPWLDGIVPPMCTECDLPVTRCNCDIPP